MGFYLPGPEGVASPGVAPDGLRGQYLRKASDLDFDTEWAEVEATAAVRVSNNFYAVGKPFSPFESQAAGGGACNANTIYFIPFSVNKSGIVNTQQFRVTTAAASALFQVAVYKSSNGLPTGSPLGITASMAASAVANTISTTFTPFPLIEQEVYFLAVNVSSGTTVTFLALLASSLYPHNVAGSPATLPVTTANLCFNYILSHTFGSFPTLVAQSLGVIAGASRAPVAWFTYSQFL